VALFFEFGQSWTLVLIAGLRCHHRMTISDQPSASLLESVLNAQTVRVTTDVALLKKSQDLMKQQGQAMVEILEQAGTVGSTHLLDAYA